MSRSRNQVSVTLTGRDQLTKVVQNANKSLNTLNKTGRLLAGVGLAKIFMSASSAAKSLARDLGGDLQKEVRRTENLMNATVQTMIESVIGTDGMSKANDFLANQVLPRVITAFEMTIDVMKTVISWIGSVIRRILSFAKAVARALGPLIDRVFPGFSDRLKENVAAFVEWGEAQVDVRRETLATNYAIIAQGNEMRKTTATFSQKVRWMRTLMEAGHGTTAMYRELADSIRRHREIAIDPTRSLQERADAITAQGEEVETMIAGITQGIQIQAPRIAQAFQGGLMTAVAMVPTAPIAQAFGEKVDRIVLDVEHIIESATRTIGDALFDGFASAFSGEGVSGLLRNFGATMLDGLGQIFSDTGRQLIGFGQIMQRLQAWLVNPLTAGPAAIAAGAALIALGGTLSGIAQRTGSRGQGRPLQTMQASGVGIQDEGQATLVIHGGLLDMSDPRQKNALARALGQLSGRRVQVQSA